MAESLLEKGIYVIAFSYPVVPKEKARIRVQLSAAHTPDDIDFAVAQFTTVKRELNA
jgi:glycine C-acetyltransferase